MATPSPTLPGVPSVLTTTRDARQLAASATHPAWWRGLLDVPLKITIVIVTALIVRWIINRLIHRIAEGIATGRGGLSGGGSSGGGSSGGGSSGGGSSGGDGRAGGARLGSPAFAARRQARARTTASVLRSATTATVSVIAALTVLQILQIGFGPALAGVSVIGIAVGLGAQAIIKDLLAGIFMIIEDQYGVGDVVDLGEASGTVESVGLRVTRLRDEAGTIWYLRNGEIGRVGNTSQGRARSMLDVVLTKDQGVARAQDVLLSVARDLARDDVFAPVILGDPEVWGVESVTADGVAVRLVVTTQPGSAGEVLRELRGRILARFEAEHLPPPVSLSSPDASPAPAAS